MVGAVVRGIIGALAVLLAGGCGLVLDLGPDDEPTVAVDGGGSTGDAGAADAGAPGTDAGSADAAAPDGGGDACVAALEECNGVDDDCDGMVDEGCDCDRYVLSGGDGAGLTADDPIASIQSAIDSMTTAGETGSVCVAASSSGGGCVPTTYTEAVTMAEGVSVYGGYTPAPDTWTRTDPSCETVIQSTSDTGVLFGHTLTGATVLDGFTAHGRSGVASSAAITVQGGATISGNRVFGGNVGSEGAAIRLTGCGAETVSIVGNAEVVGALEGSATAYGIVSNACTVTVEANGIVSGREGGTGDGWGVVCEGGSTCTVQRNRNVTGIGAGAGATGDWGRGVALSDASTADVLQNESITGCLGTASYCLGVVIADAVGRPLIDRNVIEPSSGYTWNSGILVRRANALVSNNLVVIGRGNGIELNLNRPDGSTTEATVHSNTVVAPSGVSSGRLLLVDYEGPDVRPPNGVFRNNIAACLGSSASSLISFSELGNSGKPRIFENNDVWGCPSIYTTSTGLVLSLTSIDSLPGASGNMSVDPMFVSATDYHLQLSSTLIDAGTSSGTVPPVDFDGEARPRGSGPDVGFDEAD